MHQIFGLEPFSMPSSLAALEGFKRKQRERDREKAEAKKMMQQQHRSEDVHCKPLPPTLGHKKNLYFSVTKLCKSFFSPLM
uniref:Uncharacterized protein n=1 Tax=Picea sitchensis TaxID=3332 RepID=A9NQU7_PICSI|nr:unknown [Picea sitchensis]